LSDNSVSIPERTRLPVDKLKSRGRIFASLSTGVIVGLLAIGISPLLLPLALPLWVGMYAAAGYSIKAKRQFENWSDQRVLEAQEQVTKQAETKRQTLEDTILKSEKRVVTANDLNHELVKTVARFDTLKGKTAEEEVLLHRVREVAHEIGNDAVKLLKKVREEEGGGSYWVDDLHGHVPAIISVLTTYLDLTPEERTDELTKHVIAQLEESQYAINYKRDKVSDAARLQLKSRLRALALHQIPDDQKEKELWDQIRRIDLKPAESEAKPSIGQ